MFWCTKTSSSHVVGVMRVVGEGLTGCVGVVLDVLRDIIEGMRPAIVVDLTCYCCCCCCCCCINSNSQGDATYAFLCSGMNGLKIGKAAFNYGPE